MNEFVIDTSVLAQAFIEETESLRSQWLVDQLYEPDQLRLHTMEFALVECANIIWKRIRFHGLSTQEATVALETLRVTPLTFQPIKGLLARAVIIGIEQQLAIYDSMQIALAESLKLSLITVDVKQASAAQKVGVTVKPITDFPELS